MAASLDLTGLVLPEVVEERGRSDDGQRAEFVLQPLEQGFGHTLGNSIRRIMLSALPGAAIWAFRADGVQHQHQSIEGVAEDVHQIIQHLKNLILELDEEKETATLSLSVHEPGVVRAGMIAENADVEILNPEQKLFTLQEEQPENRPLRMEFWVKRGRGFVVADRHREPEEGIPVDLIKIDAIFNPVTKANFRVTETRVGQRTDFDKLSLRVETNGALDPADAVAYAAEIARTHMEFFARFGGPVEVVTGEGDGAAAVHGRRMLPDELAELLKRPLEDFDEISVRSRNTLDKADIRTLGDIASRSRDEILDVPNFGEKSLDELDDVMGRFGLDFGMALERDEEGNLYIRESGTGANGAGREDDEA
jgi:DNA-directed RNA polymerase subunit alpha